MEISEYIEYFDEDVDMEHDEKSKLCDICRNYFKSKGALRHHINSVHKAIKYSCDQCQYRATEQGNLKKHIESVQLKLELRKSSILVINVNIKLQHREV